ncbi:MAG: hypothetical protein QW116_02995 [Zestosphaera sp.]
MGRVSRRYAKENSEVTIVNTLDSVWRILEEPSNLGEVRELLAELGDGG